jgi:uncharacterized protein YgiM (DUF1202 family)
MKPIQKLIAVSCMLTFVMTACNIGVKPPSASNVNDVAATIVAQTLQAVTESAVKGQTENTPTSAVPRATQATATSTTPILTINNPTNCRSGPGTNFQLITAFNPGTRLTILGKDTADNYWLVQLPQSQDTCWASGEYATASGSFASLPDVTPTAGAASGVPARPGSLFYQWQGPCSSLTTTLNWTDNANNETGYHVYRDNTLIADLPANSTSYTDTTSVPLGATVTFSVEAYNAIGASPQRTISFACQ